MLADTYRVGELGQPGEQPFPGGPLQRRQVFCPLGRLCIVPLTKFRRQLQQPCKTIGPLKRARVPLPPGIRPPRPSCPVTGSCQGASGPCRKILIRIGSCQTREQPVTMHRRVPIETSEEGRRKLPGRLHILVAAHHVGNLVRILAMHTFQRQLSETRSGLGIASRHLPGRATRSGR